MSTANCEDLIGRNLSRNTVDCYEYLHVSQLSFDDVSLGSSYCSDEDTNKNINKEDGVAKVAIVGDKETNSIRSRSSKSHRRGSAMEFVTKDGAFDVAPLPPPRKQQCQQDSLIKKRQTIPNDKGLDKQEESNLQTTITSDNRASSFVSNKNTMSLLQVMGGVNQDRQPLTNHALRGVRSDSDLPLSFAIGEILDATIHASVSHESGSSHVATNPLHLPRGVTTNQFQQPRRTFSSSPHVQPNLLPLARLSSLQSLSSLDQPPRMIRRRPSLERTESNIYE